MSAQYKGEKGVPTRDKLVSVQKKEGVPTKDKSVGIQKKGRGEGRRGEERKIGQKKGGVPAKDKSVSIQKKGRGGERRIGQKMEELLRKTSQ